MKVMPEDLMDLVIAADSILRQNRGDEPSHPAYWKRTWIEPWFNLLGWMMGQVLVCLPWPLRWRADQMITTAMGGRPDQAPAQLEAARRDFAALAQRLRDQTGTWPATMVFMSHPATTGALEWLRFELVREGLLLGNSVTQANGPGRLYRPAPQAFLAIDPFALDTVPTPAAGWYAGFMHRIYLVLDRQSGTQGFLQRHLMLRGSGYTRIAHRLLRRLKHDIPVVMVLPGGLPHNARLLYAAREFVQGLPVRRWPYPKRTAQKKWMEAVSQPVNGTLPIQQGELPSATRTELKSLLREWGFSDGEHARWLDAFEKEFRQSSPYRTRLFRLLVRRLVARGKPLLWISVAHRESSPYIQLASPWGAYRTSDGELRLIRGVDGRPEPLSDIAQMAMDFSREFVV